MNDLAPPTRRPLASGAAVLGIVLIAPQASADTLFVDSATGTPGALGTELDPLPTITEALAQSAGEGPHVIELTADS